MKTKESSFESVVAGYPLCEHYLAIYLTEVGFTPLQGMKVKGGPVCTIVRGNVVMDHGNILVKPGFGKFVPAQD